MPAYLSFPFDFLKFWYISAPKEILLYFISFNKAFLEMFSLPLLVKTFFQPIKNEYRKGLVAFSIGMGMFVKTWIIIIDLIFLTIILAVQVLLLVGFLLWPIITFRVLFF